MFRSLRTAHNGKKHTRYTISTALRGYLKVKVKCTLVQALWLCTGRTAHRGSSGIALPFQDHGTRRGEGSASRPGHSLPPGKARYPSYRRLGGPQGRSGQLRKISPPTGIWSPDRPARSQSLYRLCYPAHTRLLSKRKNLPILDTSASLKKTKTRRRILFTKFWVFSYTFYNCMELLYMTIVKKKGPLFLIILTRYLHHVSIFVFVYLVMVSDRNMCNCKTLD